MSDAQNLPGQDLQSLSVFPRPEDLRHGDLIWCRARHTALLRDVEAAPAPARRDDPDHSVYGPTAEEDWLAERDAFIASAQAPPGAGVEARKRAAAIADMQLEEFLNRYQGAAIVGAAPGRELRAPDSQTLISTGHVAIIAVDDAGQPRVVEACRPALAAPKTYAQWLERFRKPFYVWQGRLGGGDGGLPAAVADTALGWAEHEYTGRPFSLWNFQLDDPSAFYCAKFVWMAVFQASGGKLGLDGNRDPQRRFLQWCTPLSLMRSSLVEMLFDPTTYGLTDRIGRVAGRVASAWTRRPTRSGEDA